MANIIRQKRGTSDPSASDFSETAELLVNTTDGGLFTKTDSGSVVEVGAPIVQDKIEEGDSSVEVIDTGSNGTINLTTEGSIRLSVKNDGKVGINTTSPLSTFNPVGDVTIGNPGVAGTYLNIVGAGAQEFGIRGGGGPANPESKFAILGSTSDGDLRFRLGGTEYLRLKNTGFLGLGTNSPTQELHVLGTSNATTLVENNSAVVGTYARLQFKTGGSGTGAVSAVKSLRMASATAATNLSFETTSGSGTTSEVLRLTDAGRVGVGTTSPASKLSVVASDDYVRIGKGSATNFCGLLLDRDNSGSSGAFLGLAGASGQFATTAAQHDVVLRSESNLLFAANGSSEKARLTTDGKFGVGTSSPQVILHAFSASGGNYLRFEQADGKKFNLGLSNGDGIIDVTGNNPLRVLVNGGTEAYRVTGGGNVGIGVTSPSERLQVSGTVLGTSLSTGASGTGINVSTNTISGPATLTLDPAAVGDNTGTVVIAGDLQVDGTTTTVNSTAVTLDSKTLTVASGAADAAAANDSGLVVDGASASILYKSASDSFTFNKSVDLEGLKLADDKQIELGDSGDLKIWHNGFNSIINDEGTGELYLGGNSSVNITNGALDEFKAKFITDGAVELYYDNVKKFETTSSGVEATGLEVTGSSSLGTGTGNVVLQYNGSTRFTTTSWGGQLTGGTIQFLNSNIENLRGVANDTNSILLKNNTGTALEINHASSNSYIKNSVGDLIIENQSTERLRVDTAGIDVSGKAIVTEAVTNSEDSQIKVRNSGTDAASISFQNSFTGTSNGDGFWVGIEGQAGPESNDAYIWYHENRGIFFGTNNALAASILGNGNFGIGTASPSQALDVVGNIAVSGTVDGRDVATDGTKLDGIESGATADQTATEIKTAYESNSDTNAFTDAEKTKLSGIAANATVYNDAAVDTHLNTSTASSGEVLSYNGTDYAWVTNSGGSSYTNSDVDAHLNLNTASSGEILAYDGSDYDWVDAYNNTSVDNHLNLGTVSSNQILGWDGSDYDWVDRYENNDVDAHLNQNLASSNQLLQYDGSDYAWTDPYENDDVDAHLNQNLASANEILSYDGSDYAWVSQYTNSSVDSHLNQNLASSNQLLYWTGSDYNWIDFGDYLNESTASANELLSWNGTDYAWVDPYTNTSVDNHLNLSTVSSNQILGWDGSDYDWVDRYTNTDVDDHLNISTASSSEILGWDGSDYQWVEAYDNTDVDDHLNISTASANEVLSYDGSDYAWVEAYDNTDVDDHLNVSTASSNEVLSWDGSDYQWVAQGGSSGTPLRYLHVDGSGSQAVTTSLATVDFDTTITTSDASDFTVGSGGEITVVNAGTYSIEYSLDGDQSSGNNRVIVTGIVQVNGNTVTGSECSVYSRNTADGDFTAVGSCIAVLSANDVVRVQVQKNDAGITTSLELDTSALSLFTLSGSGPQGPQGPQGPSDIPQNSQTSAYTLVASDNGKHINTTTGGVTIPSGVFSAGNAITIYNDSSSNQTITQGSSVTLRLAGSANTGNRTLAQYGLCSLLCVGSNEFVISGAGLT